MSVKGGCAYNAWDFIMVVSTYFAKIVLTKKMIRKKQ